MLDCQLDSGFQLCCLHDDPGVERVDRDEPGKVGEHRPELLDRSRHFDFDENVDAGAASRAVVDSGANLNALAGTGQPVDFEDSSRILSSSTTPSNRNAGIRKEIGRADKPATIAKYTRQVHRFAQSCPAPGTTSESQKAIQASLR